MNSVQLSQKFSFEDDFTSFARETIFTYQNGYIYFIDYSDGQVKKMIDVSVIKNPVRCYYFNRYIYVYNYEEVAIFDNVNDTLTVEKMEHSSDKKIIYSFFSQFRVLLLIYEDLTMDFYKNMRLFKTCHLDKKYFDKADMYFPFSSDFSGPLGYFMVFKDGAIIMKQFDSPDYGFCGALLGYESGSAIYQPYPGYFFYKRNGDVVRFKFANNNILETLVNVKEILNPSDKFMVYLIKDDRVVINDCVYKNIQAPCKLFGQHNDELIVIDANNVLWNLSAR